MDVSRDQEMAMPSNLCTTCRKRDAEFGDSQCVVCQDRQEPPVPIKVRMPVVIDDAEADMEGPEPEEKP